MFFLSTVGAMMNIILADGITLPGHQEDDCAAWFAKGVFFFKTLRPLNVSYDAEHFEPKPGHVYIYISTSRTG